MKNCINKCIVLTLIMSIILVTLVSAQSDSAIKENNFKYNILSISEEATKRDDVKIKNINVNDIASNLILESQFDAVVLDIKDIDKSEEMLRSFVKNGTPVVLHGENINIEDVKKILPDIVVEENIEPESQKYIKSIYLSQVNDIPIYGTISYPPVIVEKIEEELSPQDMPIFKISTKDIYDDVLYAIEDIASVKTNYNMVKDNIDSNMVIQSVFPPSDGGYVGVFFSNSQVLTYMDVDVGRYTCLVYVYRTNQTSTYSQWDFIASMQAIPLNTSSKVDVYKTRLSVDSFGQDIIDFTQLTSNTPQTVSLSAGLPPISWSTDLSGYNTLNYGGYLAAMEWTATRQLLHHPWGNAQVMRPGIRAHNFNVGYDMMFSRYYYAEFIQVIMGTQFKVKPASYYYSTIQLADPWK